MFLVVVVLCKGGPKKRNGHVCELIVPDFFGVLSTITHMHYIKLHREAKRLEVTRGSISKGPVLTMFKNTYVLAVLLLLSWSSICFRMHLQSSWFSYTFVNCGGTQHWCHLDVITRAWNWKDKAQIHQLNMVSKGQLISKCLFGIFNSPN